MLYFCSDYVLFDISFEESHGMVHLKLLICVVALLHSCIVLIAHRSLSDQIKSLKIQSLHSLMSTCRLPLRSLKE